MLPDDGQNKTGEWQGTLADMVGGIFGVSGYEQCCGWSVGHSRVPLN
jgi:hypothetical protein